MSETKTYPLKRKMTCTKCGGTSFEFVWDIESKEDEFSLIMCHDGIGFQLEDADQKCVKCGNSDSDFIEIRVQTTTQGFRSLNK